MGLPPADEINPYSSPASSGDGVSSVPASPGDGISSDFELTREEVTAFVGEKHLYYWRAWQRGGRGGVTQGGFNGGAFFFSVSWFLYRKLYREFGIACGLLVAEIIAMTIARKATGQNLRGLERAIDLALSVLVGTMANGLYLRHARRVIAEVRAEAPDPARRLEILATRGGTSILWALVGTVGFVAAVLIVASR